MVDCSRIENLLSEYIDEELSKSDFIDVENHLSVCADCRAELAALRALVSASNEIETAQPPADLRMRIAAATTQKQRGGRWVAVRDHLFSFRPLAWAGGAAVAMFALLFVISIGKVSEPVKRIATQPEPAAPIVASHALPQTTTEQIASAESGSVGVSEPAPRTSARRVVSTKHTKRPIVVALVPKTVVVPKAEAARPVVAETKKADDSVEQTIVVDDTTTAQTVAALPVSEPSAETAAVSKKSEKQDLTRIASSPAISNDNAEEWTAEMKSKAAMQRRGRPSNVVSVINARF